MTGTKKKNALALTDQVKMSEKNGLKLFYGILALAVLMRIPVYLNPQLGMESIYVLTIRDAPVSDLIRSAAAVGHAPLLLVVIGLWARITTAEWWVLIVPMALNLASIYLIYRIAGRWAGARAGLIAALLAAVSPFMIHASVIPRYDGFCLLFGALSVYSAFEILDGRARPGTVLTYIVSTIAGLYSFYYFIFLVAFQNLYFIYRRGPVKYWLPAQAAAAALFLPWLPSMLGQGGTWLAPSKSVFAALASIFAKSYFFNIADVMVSYTAGAHYPIHENDILSRIVFLTGCVLPVAAFAGAFLARKTRKTEKTVWKAAVYLTALQFACLFMALFGYIWKGLPFFPKYGVAFAPAWYVLLGAGISALKPRPLRIGLVGAALIAAGISFTPYYREMVRPNEFKAAMETIKRNERPGDVILVTPPYFSCVVKYYYRGRLEFHGVPADHDMIRNEFGKNATKDQIRARVREFTSHPRVWEVAPDAVTFKECKPDLVYEELIDSGYSAELERGFLGNVLPDLRGRLTLFEKTVAPGAQPSGGSPQCR